MIKKTLVSLIVISLLSACGATQNMDHLVSRCYFDKPNPKKSGDVLQWSGILSADDSDMIIGCSYLIGGVEYLGVPAGNICTIPLSGAAGTGNMVFTRTDGVKGLSWKSSAGSGTLPCYEGHGGSI